MTSSRRARRRRRQARAARLGREWPDLEAWQIWASAVAAAIKQMAWSFNYISHTFGKAAMGYDDRFAEKDEETLALGSLVGIRYWSVSTPFHTTEGETAMQLTGARGPWTPGDNAARCYAPARHPGAMIPVRTCGCGFWAYWAEDWARGTSYVTRPDVAGMIEGWGGYRAGTKGFRCARAKIVALCVQAPQDEAWRVACEEALAAAYKVPVYSTVATMLKAFPPTRSPQPSAPSGGSGGGSVYAQGGLVPGPSWTGGGGGGSSTWTTGSTNVVSGGGYSSGSWAGGNPNTYWPRTEVVSCRCGLNYGLVQNSEIVCLCGVKWRWDGLTQPKMIPPLLPSDVLKQLDQKKDPSS